MKLNIFLEGENIYLRGLVEADACGNYKYWFNDKDVCGGNSHHRFPVSEDNLKKYIHESNDCSNKVVLAIIDRATDIHIGNVSLQGINYINRSAEFAIIIGEKEYWGRGLGEEVGHLIIKHAFNSLNLNRIHCGTYSTNKGMQRLAHNLGFEQEGVRKEADFKEGNYIDVVEYGLLKTRWLKDTQNRWG